MASNTAAAVSVGIERIEMNNFKSYLGKVSVGPFTNFSCIVGPNGSGKSNIMDALSFVLGTNASALRGRKPADFVNRSAQKQECSVTVVVKHGKNEVRLTRGINAKGNVSVAFNDKEISEVDFTAALRKLRISPRTSTFLVFQHEVEAMAQKKGKDLTDLIEQISGSAELKAEYDAKKRSLEAANESLTNASIEKRGATAEVHQMRLHKKEAERYTEVITQLDDKRRELALAELFSIECTLAKEKAALVAMEEKAKTLEKSITSEDDLKKMKMTYADRHKSYLELLKANRTAGNDAREKHAAIARIRASIDHYQRKVDQITQELASAKDSKATRSKETARLEEQLHQHEAALTAFNKECDEQDKKVSAHSNMNPKQLEEYKTLKRDADCQTISQRQELETVRRQQESIGEGLKQANLALDNQAAAKKELLAALERNSERVTETKSKSVEAAASIDELEAALKAAKQNLQQARDRRVAFGDELRSLENQLHELRHLKEDNRHGAKSAETLQALRAMFKGVRGRLVDICVPEERYRNAVTVALGKNLEAVVVDTTETALACVRYLKEQRISSMTFIPLNSAQGKEVDDSLRAFGGSCKPVVDVVKYDLLIEPAIRYALGQTLVCDRVDEARRIAFQQSGGERHKVVTVDGTVLMKNGSIQGGLAAVQSRARKWDERKYGDLKAAREKLLGDAAGGSEAEEARIVCEVQSLEARLESAKRRVASQGTDLSTLAAEAKSIGAEIAKNDKISAELQKRLDAYTAAIAKTDTEIDRLQAAVAEIEGKVFKDFKKVVGIDDIAELERKEALRARIRAEKRRQYAVVIQKLKLSIEAESRRVGVRQPEAIEEQLTKATNDLRTCQKEFKDYHKLMESSSKHTDDAQKKVTAAKAELDALEINIRNSAKSCEHEVRHLVGIRKQMGIHSSMCAALRQQRTALFERCRMAEVDLPTTTPDEAGAKRGRKEGVAGRGRGAREEVEIDSEDLIVSEAFVSYTDGADTATGSQGNARRARPSTGDVNICIDFSSLDQEARREAVNPRQFDDFKQRVAAIIDQLERELEAIAPNLKATTKFGASEQKLGASTTHVEKARDAQRNAVNEFHRVKEMRVQRFMATFEKLVDHVDRVYRELTMDTRGRDVHGSAYLTLDDNDEPYNAGTKYHAVPPMKRFMTIDALSGGERTMAALALLFAIHSIAPTPFFVLDEVDAALDSGNVKKLGDYLRNHAAGCQYIVVSLKEQLYHKADTLVGVFKDQDRQSSGTLSLDLKKYPQ